MDMIFRLVARQSSKGKIMLVNKLCLKWRVLCILVINIWSYVAMQAWCILLNDRVSFRMQWPQFADLQVNGMDFSNLFPLVKCSCTAAASPAFSCVLEEIMVSEKPWSLEMLPNCFHYLCYCGACLVIRLFLG